MSARQAATPWTAVGAFAGTVVCAVLFALSYVLGWGTEALGLSIGGALAFLSLGLALWSRALDRAEPEYVEERALGPAPDRDFEAFHAALTEQPVARSRVLWAMLGVAVTSLAGAALFPLRSLFARADASPDRILTITEWRLGLRLVTEEGLPVRPEEVTAGSIITVFPDGVDPRSNPDTTTVLLRVPPDELRLPPERLELTVDGVVAYSKICTHAGCPVGLYADTYGQLLCPCHFSVFDVVEGAVPIEGPAPRRLPQLPIGVDDEGYLVALGDFPDPVGPAWWRYPA